MTRILFKINFWQFYNVIANTKTQYCDTNLSSIRSYHSSYKLFSQHLICIIYKNTSINIIFRTSIQSSWSLYILHELINVSMNFQIIEKIHRQHSYKKLNETKIRNKNNGYTQMMIMLKRSLGWLSKIFTIIFLQSIDCNKFWLNYYMIWS